MTTPRAGGMAADRADERRRMVEQIVAHAAACAAASGRAVLAPRVLDAMRVLPRHAFVRADQAVHAYEDRALPSGPGVTISQPFVVALMTDLLAPQPDHRVLEIGTGLGYQTALLARLAARVFSIERVAALSDQAHAHLASLGVANVELRVGDGRGGWPDAAPFDRILVAAAPQAVPPALVAQLAPGGRLVLPIGPRSGQRLYVVERDAAGAVGERPGLPVIFTPLEDDSGAAG
jgi:protein-L-isoaspartate(D-aspartate) O-methyltransferase